MIAFLALAAFQAAAVPAAPARVAPPTAAKMAAAGDDKVICQTQETTGTRLGGHKVCMTKAQWKESVIQQRDAVKHAQDNLGYQH